MENNALAALLMSTLAGSATMIGAIAAVLFRPTNKTLCIALAFSAGGMTAVSLGELLPHAHAVIEMYMPHNIGLVALFLACCIGALLGAMINAILPKEKSDTSSLFRVGVFSMIAMILHNIPEGIAVFLSGYSDTELGLSMAFAIAVHNIPEGLAIAMPVYASSKGVKMALIMAFWASLAEPFGALLAWLFLAPYITENLLAFIYAIIAGLMLYIAGAELFPTAALKGSRKMAITSLIVGFAGTFFLLSVANPHVH